MSKIKKNMSEYSTPTKFIDLDIQQKKIRKKIDDAIIKVLDHGQYIMGPEVKELEQELKLFTGSRNVISCANGTDALTLVLMSWDISYDQAVFVPSFTYVATAEAVSQLGAKPFFVDVDKDTYNIDIESFKSAIVDARKLGLKATALIAVDLFGLPSDIDPLMEIAEENNIKVLIDAAQSFGATSNKRKVGTMGHATTTSFFPAKPFGCYGDGGAVFTENNSLAKKIESIRLHGKGSHKYENVRVGLNSRLDTIQAAILLEKLKIFPSELCNRQKVADLYGQYLKSLPLKIPAAINGHNSSWAQYTIQIDNRDYIQSELAKRNIPSIVYYPIPLSKQKGYKNSEVVSTGVKVSEYLSKNVLSLPMHPYLEEKKIKYICENLKDVIES